MAGTIITRAAVVLAPCNRITVCIAGAIAEVCWIDTGIVGVTNPVARTLFDKIAGGGRDIAGVKLRVTNFSRRTFTISVTGGAVVV